MADKDLVKKRGKTIKAKWTTDDRGNKIVNPLYTKQKELFFNKRKATHGYGKAYMKGGRAK